MTNAIITKTYNDTTVLTFREDGWFNMTKAAKAFDRRLDKFWESQETKDYVFALSNTLKTGELMETKRGGQGGTWAHPKLAVFFARWLNTKFAVWCDIVIDDILRGKAEVVVTKPEQSEIMKMPTTLLEAGRLWLEALERSEALKLENTELKEEVAVLEHKTTHITISQFRTHCGWVFPKDVASKISAKAKKLAEAAGDAIGKTPYVHIGPDGTERHSFMDVYPVKHLEEALIALYPARAIH